MAVETKALKCIKCGKGCKLTVTLEDGKVTDVDGNKCSRGPKYARKKLNDAKKDKASKKKKKSIIEKIKKCLHK